MFLTYVIEEPKQQNDLFLNFNYMKYSEIQLEIIKVFGIVKDNYSDEKYLTCDKCWELFRSKFYSKPRIDTPYNYLRCGDCNPKDVTSITSIPHLEDVFRVAEDNWAYLSIDNFEETISFRKSRYKELEEIQYNPALPLLEQPESTLQELLKLFSND